MPVSKISYFQLTALMFLFMFGTSVIVPPGGVAGNSAWVVIILGAIWSCFLVSIYKKLQEFFPDKTLIEYLNLTFGRFLGAILAFLYIVNFFILSTLILRDIIDFLKTLPLDHTPDYFLSLITILPVALLVNKGFGTIGKIALVIFPLTVFQVISATIVLTPIMEPSNILPLFAKGFKPIVKGFIIASGWPFGEIIAFTMIFSLLPEPKKVFFSSLKAISLVSILFIIISLRNQMVLNTNIIENLMYPSLTTFAAIELPGLGRIDVFIMLVFFSATIIKLLVNYYVAVLALQQVLALKDYKILSFAFGILISVYAVGIYENVFGVIEFGEKYYPYFLVILSFIVPSLTLIIAMFKKTAQIKV